MGPTLGPWHGAGIVSWSPGEGPWHSEGVSLALDRLTAPWATCEGCGICHGRRYPSRLSLPPVTQRGGCQARFPADLLKWKKKQWRLLEGNVEGIILTYNTNHAEQRKETEWRWRQRGVEWVGMMGEELRSMERAIWKRRGCVVHQ